LCGPLHAYAACPLAYARAEGFGVEHLLRQPGEPAGAPAPAQRTEKVISLHHSGGP